MKFGSSWRALDLDLPGPHVVQGRSGHGDSPCGRIWPDFFFHWNLSPLFIYLYIFFLFTIEEQKNEKKKKKGKRK
jgi:hypothetical protein